ncbi:TraB/GumN family protein [Shouchella tritolerans]|uniref:TraB/GumN family protein n=1 Tax=Shouchella tritolerans TaxID=2979466 RepID=UPI0021E721E8|nr:TraB/GumN family protein [Shouchella tritolerans]
MQTLQKNVRHFKNLPKETEQSALDWLNRDYEALKKIREDYEEAGINKEYFEQLNDQRNLKMSKKLDQTIQFNQDQTFFVFVGTFHVILEPSIPTLLEKEGYRVERIL